MFSKRLPVDTLASHCQGLRYYLEAGLTLAQGMKNQAKKGPVLVRPVAGRMGKRLEKGEGLHEVLQDERDYFPPLYLTLANVAEETGKLPEALRELQDYFRMQHQLWRNFISQITWPAIQFTLAVLVMSLLIYILGEWLPDNPISVFGLKGANGSLIFLAVVFGGLAALFGGYWFLSHVVKKGGPIDRFLLGIPYVGGCLQALALSRFAMAMGILVEAGTRMHEAVRLSLEATSNHAFADRARPAATMIKEGQSLVETLAEQRIFPQDFLDIVETAEVGGREPDAFNRMAKQYHEIATDRMKVLANVAGWAVWLMVAIFIIALMINLWSQYFGVLNSIKV